MAAVQEQDPGPHADRQLMLSFEIVIQAAQQQLFNTRFTIPLGHLGGTGVESARIGLGKKQQSAKKVAAIMSRTGVRHKTRLRVSKE